MQSRGDFVPNKARYLMNTDDVDLCVYPKSISGEKSPTKPHPIPPITGKRIPRGLCNDVSWFGGILPTNQKLNDFSRVNRARTARAMLSQRGCPLCASQGAVITDFYRHWPDAAGSAQGRFPRELGDGA